jgi:hypothetical protein
MARPSQVRTNIARLRLALLLNQNQFARLLRRSTACVQSLELGRLRLSSQLAGEISSRTAVNPRWLLDNKLDEPPYDMSCKPWSMASFQKLHSEIPYTAKQGDEVFRQRMLEVATQLALARNMAGVRRLYRAMSTAGEVLDIGRKLDQFIAGIMMEKDLRPDLNMTEEVRFAEREAERKSQNVLRVMGVSWPAPVSALGEGAIDFVGELKLV